MKAVHMRLIQKDLKLEGFRPGPVDGLPGRKIYSAVEKSMNRRSADLPDGWKKWSLQRKTISYLQLMCKDRGIEVGAIDGFWGPQTEYAAGVLEHFLKNDVMPRPWRDDTPLNVNPNGWPSRDEADLITYYGEPGTNQRILELPYPHRLAWNTRKVITRIPCHEKVCNSMGKVLQGVLDHYGLERIREMKLDLWGGCLNVRRERGGTRWSTHSWGIAADYAPSQNPLVWGRDRSLFAKSEYDIWWRLWEEEGWTSLGRTKNFDWMHVQAAKQ